MKIALDSNVFIAFLAQEEEFFDQAATIMQALEAGTVKGVCSSLVFGEILRLPTNPTGNPGSILPIMNQFFSSIDCTDYPADRNICIKAAELRNTYPALKLPDAIHLATAVRGRADQFITADKRLLNAAKSEISCVYLQDFHTA